MIFDSNNIIECGGSLKELEFKIMNEFDVNSVWMNFNFSQIMKKILKNIF